MFCAICTETIPPGAPSFPLDGATICAACHGDPVDSRVPEAAQRGYGHSESATKVCGHQFRDQVSAGATKVMGRKKKKNYAPVPARSPSFQLAPNEVKVRHPMRVNGVTLDSHEAKARLEKADPRGVYRHLVTVRGWHMFAKVK